MGQYEDAVASLGLAWHMPMLVRLIEHTMPLASIVHE